MLTSKKSIDGVLIKNLSRCSERKVKARCDKCGRDLVIIWANYFRSQQKRNFDNKTFCRSCISKENMKIAKKNGPWNKGYRKPIEERKGKPYITTDGYMAVFQYKHDRFHSSQWANYRKEHLVIMEKILNRPLNKNEVVHHIDGNKINNSPENLWLTNSKGHKIAHSSLQDIGYELYKQGKIYFNKETGKYETK